MIDTVFGSLWSPGTGEFLWKVLVAFAVAAVVIVITRQIAKASSRIGMRLSESPAIANLAATMTRFIGLLLALFVGLRVLELDATAYSLLAGAGVVSLIVGFALKDIAANFIAGIILAILRPFRVGHLVDTNDTYGIVKKIRLRSTQIQTLDGQQVHIPNQSILLGKVADYSYIPFRRVDLEVGVGYDSDLAHVKEVARDTISKLAQIDDDHSVEVYFTKFADSSITLEVRFWVAFSQESQYLEARSGAIETIHAAFRTENITIPYPTVTMKN